MTETKFVDRVIVTLDRDHRPHVFLYENSGDLICFDDLDEAIIALAETGVGLLEATLWIGRECRWPKDHEDLINQLEIVTPSVEK